jgi:hypothetical protein
MSPLKKLTFISITLAFVFGIAAIFGEIAVRIIAPQNLSSSFRISDKHGIQVHQPGESSRHQLGDRVAKYKLRPDGLRDYGAAQAEKRILLLGDSFTFGWLLNAEHTFINHLQNKVDDEFGKGRMELLNGGHGGWGTSDYIRYYEEYGEDYGLSGVIVFFNGDDIGRSIRRGQYAIRDDQKRLEKRHGVHKDSWKKKILNTVPGYSWFCEHSHLFQTLRYALIPAPPDRPVLATESKQVGLATITDAKDAEVIHLSSLLFSRLRDLAKERKQELLVLTTGFHNKTEEKKGEPTKVFYRVADTVFEELAIEYADISEKLMAEKAAAEEPITIPEDGHPNEIGARLIADMNWPYVKKFVERCLNNSGS